MLREYPPPTGCPWGRVSTCADSHDDWVHAAPPFLHSQRGEKPLTACNFRRPCGV